MSRQLLTIGLITGVILSLTSSGWTLPQTPTLRVAQARSQSRDYFDQGIQKSKAGDYQGAIADFTSALEIQDEKIPSGMVSNFYAITYVARGDAYTALEDYQQAIADYTRAIDITPHYTVAYYKRGNTYRHLNADTLALADYDQALAISPDHAKTLEARRDLFLSAPESTLVDIDTQADLESPEVVDVSNPTPERCRFQLDFVCHLGRLVQDISPL